MNARDQHHHHPRHPGDDPTPRLGSNIRPGGITVCSSARSRAVRCPGSSRPPSCASVCARAITPAPSGAGIANHATPSGRSCTATASAGVSAGPGSSRPVKVDGCKARSMLNTPAWICLRGEASVVAGHGSGALKRTRWPNRLRVSLTAPRTGNSHTGRTRTRQDVHPAAAWSMRIACRLGLCIGRRSSPPCSIPSDNA